MRLARDRSHSNESVGVVAAAPPATPLDASGLDEHERAFSEVYYRLHPRLLAVAERYVDRETARDVESETLLELWRRWPQLTAAQRADEYFIGAVRNAAKDAHKAEVAWVPLEEVEEELEQIAFVDHDAMKKTKSLLEVLEATLAAMPPRRRAVVKLLNEEELTYKEAAKALGVSFGTIKTHYRLAMVQLRAAFAQAGLRITGSPRALLPSPKGDATND